MGALEISTTEISTREISRTIFFFIVDVSRGVCTFPRVVENINLEMIVRGGGIILSPPGDICSVLYQTCSGICSGMCSGSARVCTRVLLGYVLGCVPVYLQSILETSIVETFP